MFTIKVTKEHKFGLIVQFYEIDLPHASAIKQKLVQKVLPDTNKVSQAVLLMPMVIKICCSVSLQRPIACSSITCLLDHTLKQNVPNS